MRYFRRFVGAHLLVLLAVLVLEGVNLYAYRSSPTWFVVHGVVTALALGFAAWGIRLTERLGRLDRPDLPVADDVRRRLRFCDRDYALWLWMCSLSIVMLSLAINCLVDLDVGGYRINKPVVFFGVQLVMLSGIWAVYRLTHGVYVDELRAVLYDLENQALERSGTLEVRRARFRPWLWVLVVVLLGFVVLGIVLAMRHSG